MKYRGSRTSQSKVIANINVHFVHTHARTNGDQNNLPPGHRYQHRVGGNQKRS